MAASDEESPSGRDVYDGSLSGAQDRPFIPRLSRDPPAYRPLPRSLEDYRQEEGDETREKRLRALWKRIPHSGANAVDPSSTNAIPVTDDASLTPERAKTLTKMYMDELTRRCSDTLLGQVTGISWEEFRRYAEAKEVGEHLATDSPRRNTLSNGIIELWHIFHDELDLDGNGHLDAEELTMALKRAGEYRCTKFCYLI